LPEEKKEKLKESRVDFAIKWSQASDAIKVYDRAWTELKVK